MIARCHNALSYAKSGAAPTAILEEAAAHAQSAAEHFAALGDQAMRADSLNVQAAVHIHMGRPHEAVRYARQAQAIACDIDNLWGRINTGFTLAMATFETGEYGRALAIINEGLNLASESEPTPLVAGALSVRGEMYRKLHCLERARRDHERAYTHVAQTRNRSILRVMALERAADHVVLGEWETAYALAQEGFAEPVRPSRLYGSFDFPLMIEALLHGGGVERARRAIADFGEWIDDNPRYAVPHHWSQALLARRTAGDKAAVSHLEAAADIAETLQNQGALWQVLAALGDCYERLGRFEAATHVRQRAGEIVSVLAATLPPGEIRQQFVSGAKVCL